MRSELLAAAASNRGLIVRATALTVVPRHVVDDAVAAGSLVSMYPGVYRLRDVAPDRLQWRRAALAYQPGAALSHVDALDVWGLPVPQQVFDRTPVHVTKGPGPAVPRQHIVVHRRRHFAGMPTFTVRPHDLCAVSPEQALAESWLLLPDMDRRAPIIVALRDRMVTDARLAAVLDGATPMAGTAEMRRVAELVGAGCHSELELWGHAHVFDDPRLRHAKLQHPVTVRGRTFRLDRFFELEMVDVELDGAAFHGRPGQRERDLRRDAALSTRGILTVRFSHQRLHADPVGVIVELAEILAIRRRQLAVS